MIYTTISGRLVADPEMRTTKTGKKYTNFLVSCTTDKKGDNGYYVTNLFVCAAFGKQGDIIADRFKKGMFITVCGRSSIATWQGKDGEFKAAVNIVVSLFDFVTDGTKKDMANEGVPSGEISY